MMKKSESAKSKKSGDEIIEEKRVGIRKSEKNDRKAEKEKKKAGKDMKKAEKETKKAGKEKKKPEKGKGFMLLGIRNKIVICFLVPIAFMIVIGVSAYQKAAEGLSEKFQESTLQTIAMSKEYIEMSCDFIKAEGLKYAFDGDVGKYLQGTIDSPIELKEIMRNINTDMISSSTSISFINNIHIIPKTGVNVLTTASGASADGFLM